MKLTRISISGLMAVVAVAAVVFASLRANSGVGVNLVLCIALALNFAAVVIVPTGLGPRFRLAALGYAIGGWGWMVAIALVPSIDSILRDFAVEPAYIRFAAPGVIPAALVSSPTIARLLLLVHSLCVIAVGLAWASVAWKLGARFDDPDPPTSQDSGHP